jgi:hypothetical protein
MSKLSITRRGFAKSAAVAATAVLIHPTEMLAQAATSPATPLAQKAQEALAKLPPLSRAEVETKVSEIFRRYGDRLNEEQKTDILRIMAESQPGLDKMREFLLHNEDQPATVFQVSRKGNTTIAAVKEKAKGKA